MVAPSFKIAAIKLPCWILKKLLTSAFLLHDKISVLVDILKSASPLACPIVLVASKIMKKAFGDISVESSDSELTINGNWTALMKMKTMAPSLQRSTMSLLNFSFRFLGFPRWTSAAPTWLPWPSSGSSKSVLGLKWSMAVNPSCLRFCSSLPLHNNYNIINSNLEEFGRPVSWIWSFTLHCSCNSKLCTWYQRSWVWMVLGQVDTLQKETHSAQPALWLPIDLWYWWYQWQMVVVDGADCITYMSKSNKGSWKQHDKLWIFTSHHVYQTFLVAQLMEYGIKFQILQYEIMENHELNIK